jgi:dTDP-glucose 4,6-dehydratase
MSAARPERVPGETWLVTGGAGFIGTNFVLSTVRDSDVRVVTYDTLTYAGRAENLAGLENHPRHRLVRGDVCDGALVRQVIEETRPAAIIHLAAESHVDRSIDGPAAFVRTNIVGTFTLLEAARAYWETLPDDERARFCFVQVSTDEVYGSLGADGAFTETSPYAPRSPYAASKAAADHLVAAAHATHGFPALISHSGNNFGPYQFPEKLVPVVVLSALAGQAIPVYGTGDNVRDWLSVHDHCDALRLLVRRGQPGQHYLVGAGNQISNLELVRRLCALVDELGDFGELAEPTPAADRITFVADRPGHDHRYAVDASKIQRELGWAPRCGFDDSLRRTVAWYIDNQDWCRRIEDEGHTRQRLGLGRRAQDAGEQP